MHKDRLDDPIPNSNPINYLGVAWTKLPGYTNVAPNASAQASSIFNSNYAASKAVDTISRQPDVGEWASAGQQNPWIQLSWGPSQTVDSIRLYDRPNLVDAANGGTLTFSDGSSVAVSGIPNDGKPMTITFPAKTITWLRFQVSGGSGSNVGLSEIEVFASHPNAAPGAAVSASSSFNSTYAAVNVTDAVIGQAGVGEWASLGEQNPWIRLDWASSQTIDTIRLFDRPNLTDAANGGTLTFSDGSSVAVSGIPNDGSVKTVTFSAKTVTWVKFQVSGGSGLNVGLSELQAFATKPNVAFGATRSASSVYSSDFSAAKAADGVIRQNGLGEWASAGQQNPWIMLSWDNVQTVNAIQLFDRPNLTDAATGGTLTFSDGSSIAVSGIPNDGSVKKVTFSSKTITWVKFQVSGGSGLNVGLSELQVFAASLP